MSVFASGVRSGSDLLVETLRAVLDSYLPARYTTLASGGLTSTSSSSGVNLDASGLVVSSVVADELLIYLMTHTVSVGTANAIIAGVTFRGASILNNFVSSQPAVADTNGNSDSQTPVYIDKDQSGTLTYYQQFYRNGGSGTVYSVNRLYHCVQLKRR